MKRWISELSRKEKRRMGRIALAGALFAAVRLLPLQGLWSAAAHLLPYALVGWDVLWRAARNIRNGQVFDENFLMAVATIGAFAIGEAPEAVFVMLFYQVGELFQEIAVGRSRRSIAQLMDICPESANIERDGGIDEVDPDEVAVGEVIVVRPGERIPLDGVVIEGAGNIETSALTGEAMPRAVREGDRVVSGCVNMNAALRVRVEKAYEDSTVSRILEMVENASEKKARSEQFITRFARYYTPAVVFAALFLALVPPLFAGGFAQWIHRALLFLVVSCPCALVISVPLGFFGGIGGASRRGVLIKGGNYLEALAAADTVVFDKTGTLTKGRFAVRGIWPEEGVRREELLRAAALCERYSNHPIALSLREAYGRSTEEGSVAQAEEISGKGVRALVDGQEVLVGSWTLMRERALVSGEPPKEQGTVAHVAIAGRYAGRIVIADSLKEDAGEAVAQLRRLGVRRTIMLTGDAEQTAAQIAGGLGLDEYRAELLPQDKVACLEEILARAKGKVAYVGDGINDAPVLMRADVGVAMGALGSDAAIEAADVVLMNDDVSAIAVAVRIARKTVGIVRQNIAFALGTKAIVLVLGAMGVAPMWLAVFADVGVAFIAILNSMRALR
ncbi:MAG: heavy metal translocating P-type ATPase [Eubacteriales bacterium]|nr:heavy metal translocating P-type ATPase [Eubacteriales bacterium]